MRMIRLWAAWLLVRLSGAIVRHRVKDGAGLGGTNNVLGRFPRRSTTLLNVAPASTLT